MGIFLGIDTSNYTTSIAVVRDGEVIENVKMILPVPEGGRGLRQSDALFHHTCQLPEAFKKIGNYSFDAVGVSQKPRDETGSYMPCFLAGVSVACAVSETNGIPLFRFSHQRGHFAAAAYSAGALSLLDKEFIGFHVSGGTTEIVSCSPEKINILGGTEDINAGQAIDRAGVLLGLRFPCGAMLEELAEAGILPEKPRVCVRGLLCNLSGVENQVQKMLLRGEKKEDIARYVLEFCSLTLDKLSENVRKQYDLPILYAGGVMSNRRIRSLLSKRENVFFAQPVFSSDNAAGIALLTEKEYQKHEG